MTARKAYVRSAGGWLAVSALVGLYFSDAPRASRARADAGTQQRVREPSRLAMGLPQAPSLPPSAAGLRP